MQKNFYPTKIAYSWLPLSNKKIREHADYNDLLSGYFIRNKFIGSLKKSYFFHRLKKFNSFLKFHRAHTKSRALMHWNSHYKFFKFRKFANSNSIFLSRSSFMNDSYRRGEWSNYNVMWKKHYQKTKNLFSLNQTFQKQINLFQKPNSFLLFYPLKNELWSEVSGRGFPLFGLNSIGNSASLDYPLFLNHLHSETSTIFLSFFKLSNYFYLNNIITKKPNVFKFQNLKRFFFFRQLDSIKLKAHIKLRNNMFFSKNIPSYLRFYYRALSRFDFNNASIAANLLFFTKTNSSFLKLPYNYLKYLLRVIKRKSKKRKDNNFFIRQNFLHKIKKTERFSIVQCRKLKQKSWFYSYFLKQKLKKSTFFNKSYYLLSRQNLFKRYQLHLFRKKTNLKTFKLPVEFPKYSIIWRFNKKWLKDEEKKMRREAFAFQQWYGVYPTWWEFPLQKHKRFFTKLTNNYYAW